ncbi:MAG: SDR family oxidoreductase [Acholeplasmatales bacterium]|nr:MAG: SDR family oxidoreductase [Acholeplasmatales bacterium]
MKTYLVTGGSSGIGLGLVKQLLKAGHRVINIDKVTPKDPLTGHYHFVHGDLGRLDRLDEMFDRARAHTRLIDGLILNASEAASVSFETLTLDTLSRALDVNVKASVMLAKAYAMQYLGEQGRIVFLSSTRAFMSEPDTLPYACSKGAIEAMTHNLAISLAKYHITVNAVAPGWIDTGQHAIRSLDHTFHPSQRVGHVEDVVRAIIFLLDEQNGFINGETLVIDGGVTKKMIYPE